MSQDIDRATGFFQEKHLTPSSKALVRGALTLVLAGTTLLTLNGCKKNEESVLTPKPDKKYKIEVQTATPTEPPQDDLDKMEEERSKYLKESEAASFKEANQNQESQLIAKLMNEGTSQNEDTSEDETEDTEEAKATLETKTKTTTAEAGEMEIAEATTPSQVQAQAPPTTTNPINTAPNAVIDTSQQGQLTNNGQSFLEQPAINNEILTLPPVDSEGNQLSPEEAERQGYKSERVDYIDANGERQQYTVFRANNQGATPPAQQGQNTGTNEQAGTSQEGNVSGPDFLEAIDRTGAITDYAQAAQTIMANINAVRQQLGLALMTNDATMQSIANIRIPQVGVSYRSTGDSTGHNHEGEWALQWIANRYGWDCAMAENTGYFSTGSQTAEEVFMDYYNSAAHYANMFNPNLTRMGVALYPDTDGRTYLVMNFGR